MDISANLSRIARSFEWLWNNFLRSSWDSTCLIASEQYSWGFLFLGPFWVRNLKICLVNPPVLGSNRFWLLVRTFVYQSFISNLSFEISHFTNKNYLNFVRVTRATNCTNFNLKFKLASDFDARLDISVNNSIPQQHAIFFICLKYWSLAENFLFSNVHSHGRLCFNISLRVIINARINDTRKNQRFRKGGTERTNQRGRQKDR